MTEEADERPLVVITGVTGYLGSVTFRKFIEDGSFRVRGTVRDVTNETKIGPLRRAFGAAVFENLNA